MASPRRAEARRAAPTSASVAGALPRYDGRARSANGVRTAMIASTSARPLPTSCAKVIIATGRLPDADPVAVEVVRERAHLRQRAEQWTNVAIEEAARLAPDEGIGARERELHPERSGADRDLRAARAPAQQRPRAVVRIAELARSLEGAEHDRLVARRRRSTSSRVVEQRRGRARARDRAASRAAVVPRSPSRRSTPRADIAQIMSCPSVVRATKAGAPRRDLLRRRNTDATRADYNDRMQRRRSAVRSRLPLAGARAGTVMTRARRPRRPADRDGRPVARQPPPPLRRRASRSAPAPAARAAGAVAVTNRAHRAAVADPLAGSQRAFSCATSTTTRICSSRPRADRLSAPAAACPRRGSS